MTTKRKLRVGLDFDNTIVCYDQAIAVMADNVLDLPRMVPRTKLAIRDHLRKANLETEWTCFQGELYGPGMRHAEPFDDAITTMKLLVAAGHELIIVSHRSLQPYAGEPYDLHSSAQRWVAKHLQSIGLFVGRNESISFLETRGEKIDKIAELRCDAFLDDLPEVLEDARFPPFTKGILFDPSGNRTETKDYERIMNWGELLEVLASLD